MRREVIYNLNFNVVAKRRDTSNRYIDRYSDEVVSLAASESTCNHSSHCILVSDQYAVTGSGQRWAPSCQAAQRSTCSINLSALRDQQQYTHTRALQFDSEHESGRQQTPFSASHVIIINPLWMENPKKIFAKSMKKTMRAGMRI